MTKPASHAISMWDISSPESAGYAPLDGDASTDVAIVGGGYTGCSTALHLAGHGVSSIILEAEDVGFGGSGAMRGCSMPACGCRRSRSSMFLASRRAAILSTCWGPGRSTCSR
jgi:glycine/D-amino acid oxidase-like deaminating enzyme